MRKAKIGDRNVSSAGYIRIYLPDHHRASYGWVFEHIVVMEQALGRPVVRPEVVHHLDHNRQNNDPANLVLISSAGEHIRMHAVLDKVWSRAYPTLEGCHLCGTNKRPHCALGLCKRCYNNLPAGRWSKRDDYPCCVECGTTEKPHKGGGLCVTCYARAFARTHRRSRAKKAN